MRILPWVITAAALVVAGVGWIQRRPATPATGASTPAAVAAGSRTAAPLPDLAPLRSCLGRLGATQSMLERCREARPAVDPSALSGPATACLESAEVQAAVSRTVEDELARRLERERIRRDERRGAAASYFLDRVLGLEPAQQTWMSQYVCAAEEQRRELLRTMSAGKVTDQTWATYREERERIWRDLETYLGAEKYRQLRAMGGVGLLGETLPCE